MKRTALLAAFTLFCAGTAAAAPGAGDSFSSVPAPAKQIDVVKTFQEGVTALQAEDYKTAESKFGDVLSAAPDHPEANYYMGLAKAHLGKDKQALKFFKKAVKARDNFVEAHEQLALASIRLGDREEGETQIGAIKQIEIACTAETCDQAYVDRLARAVKKIEEALAAAPAEEIQSPRDEHSNAGGGADSFAYLLLSPQAGADAYRDAVRKINQSDYSAAIASLEAAAGAIGPHPDILNYLGYANRKLGRFERAQAFYRQALTLDPQHRGANEYLGELYLEIGAIDKAKRQLARLDKICAFGCPEREDLARLIAVKESMRSAEAR